MSKHKNNPCAFLWYADDAIGGMAVLTCEEKGAYCTLLSHAWNTQGLDDDIPRLANMLGKCHGDPEILVADVLRLKFYKDADGKWRNKRQEKVRAAQQNYSQQQSERSQARWKREPEAASPPSESRSPNPEAAPPTAHEPHQPFPEVSVPSWDEVKTWAQMDGVPEAVAKEFFDHENSFGQWRAGGKINGMPINGRNALKVWFNRGRKTNASNSKSSKPSHDRNAGTYNQNRDLTAAKAKIR